MSSEMTLDWLAGPLALLGRRRPWWRVPWLGAMSAEARAMRDQMRNMEQLRYHLGRGRLARDAGRFEDGVAEARKALRANPHSAWALALLGQCLARQQQPDFDGAQRALEQAQLLEPTNGYFVRLTLNVLAAQGDVQGRADLLARAWWKGAPVDRWLPDGPPRGRERRSLADRHGQVAARAGARDTADSRSAVAAQGTPRESVLAAR
jgi:tetratricopeptide (TPR) repeat protein